jgi:hypothetical protein
VNDLNNIHHAAKRALALLTPAGETDKNTERNPAPGEQGVIL